MELSRGCGVLLHPTSLPGRYGQGELGREAYRFIDFLQKSGQGLWQVLPLNPTGYGNSPYQPFSAFAGNPMLISTDRLVEEGLLTRDELQFIPNFSRYKIQFGEVKRFKDKLLRKAFSRFRGLPKNLVYDTFVQENEIWLDNYALFMSLKKQFGDRSWNRWEEDISSRDPAALERYRKLLAEEIEYHKFLQFKFTSQWLDLKNYAHQRGIRIIGDLPIFVAHDSSDVWGNPDLFSLDSRGDPLKVAGVPPDYFSPTGQLWGNPIYSWERMAKDGYSWWRERFKQLFKFVDLVRVDHFRGFEAYWEIPAGERTAVKGKWRKGPGDKLFAVLERYLGRLPVIAEDLGIITPEVVELRTRFGYPGMKVLQFVLEAMDDPAKLEKNTVLYTGTHDNDTLLGWYKGKVLPNSQLRLWLERKLGLNELSGENEVCWTLIELAYQTRANTVIVPLQDLLALDSWARMNYPGTAEGNWEWRFLEEQLTEKISFRLNSVAKRSKRSFVD